jgi:hypothetical protein
MKIHISLYEFYAMGINSLIQKAPWEITQRVSSYNESFMYEQRLLSLAILMLMGEEYVPESTIKTMPQKFSGQVRHSVNQSVFLRALKHHYRNLPGGDKLAERMLVRMESYVTITRDANAHGADPLKAITTTLAKRVPPRDQEQLGRYHERVQKIFAYTEGLVQKSLSQKYDII